MIKIKTAEAYTFLCCLLAGVYIAGQGARGPVLQPRPDWSVGFSQIWWEISEAAVPAIAVVSCLTRTEKNTWHVLDTRPIQKFLATFLSVSIVQWFSKNKPLLLQNYFRLRDVKQRPSSIFMLVMADFIMATLRSKCGLYIFALWFLLSSSSCFFLA